jgi:hypothetical protein
VGAASLTSRWLDLRRFVRKHRLLLLLMLLFNAFLFFPLLFMGRVISPNDVYYSYDPWRTVRQIESQNPLLNDPAVAYGTLVSLLREDPHSFHWNRYIAAGIPGYGSLASAVFSPFILLPGVLLPLVLFFTGVVFLKLNVGWIGAYLWLRAESLGRTGAAIGSLVFAASGPYVVWWLWQGSNATTLYPFALLMLVRAFHGRKSSLVALFALAAAFLLSGYPATIVYGVYMLALYALFLVVRHRRLPWGALGRMSAAALLALGAVAPMIAPFVSMLDRTGYLETRAEAGLMGGYPTGHLAALVEPYRLGDPAEKFWIGLPQLGSGDNFVETTVYLGLLTLPLMLLGLFRRGSMQRWFWLFFGGLLFIVLFFASPLTSLIGTLPGLQFSPPVRLRMLLPLPAAFLTAAGVAFLVTLLRRLRWRADLLPRGVALLIGLLLTLDLAVFAGRFLSYPTVETARLPETEVVSWLQENASTWRVAPMFDALWPNSAEWMRFEDVRSQFSSESWYRSLLQRIDPGVWGGSGTVLQFNSIRADLTDPLLAMLNVRYLIEQPSIDIIRWQILERSRATDEPAGEIHLRDGAVLRRELAIDRDPIYAVEVPFHPPETGSGAVVVRIRSPEGGVVVEARRTLDELRRVPRLYLPVWRKVSAGNRLIIEVESEGASVRLPVNQAGELVVGVVETPMILLHELREGRVFENVAALPRYFAVWQVRESSFEEMLADRSIDYSTETVLHRPPPQPLTAITSVARPLRRVTFALTRYDSSRHEMTVRSAVPFLLTSSEKLTPELAVTVGGERVTPLQANGGFFAIPMPAGEHQVVVERKIGRGWWPLSAISILFIAGWMARRLLTARL